MIRCIVAVVVLAIVVAALGFDTAAMVFVIGAMMAIIMLGYHLDAWRERRTEYCRLAADADRHHAALQDGNRLVGIHGRFKPNRLFRPR